MHALHFTKAVTKKFEYLYYYAVNLMDSEFQIYTICLMLTQQNDKIKYSVYCLIFCILHMYQNREQKLHTTQKCSWLIVHHCLTITDQS